MGGWHIVIATGNCASAVLPAAASRPSTGGVLCAQGALCQWTLSYGHIGCLKCGHTSGSSSSDQKKGTVYSELFGKSAISPTNCVAPSSGCALRCPYTGRESL